MEKQYIQMMMESLGKKENILTELLSRTGQQKELLSCETVDWDAFDELTEEKGVLIDELLQLDEGFEVLFERVKKPLTQKKEVYRTEINTMKSMIRLLTDKSAELESMERRNKNLVETRMAESRQSIRQSKLGTQAALQYYQRMNRINTVDPQLMDKKS